MFYRRHANLQELSVFIISFILMSNKSEISVFARVFVYASQNVEIKITKKRTIKSINQHRGKTSAHAPNYENMAGNLNNNF